VVLTKLVQPDQALHFTPPPLYLRPLVALDAITFYLAKLAAPWGLGVDYARGPATALDSPWLALTAAAPLLVAGALWRWRRRMGFLAPPGLVLVLALGPVLGLIPFAFQNHSTVADRYMYLAMLGPAWAVALLAARAGVRGRALLAVVLAGFSVVCALQVRTWKDTTTLYRQAMVGNPESFVGNINIGAIARGEGDLARAERYFRTALRVRPGSPLAELNLGSVLIDMGRLREALVFLRRAEQDMEDNPKVHFNLGMGAYRLGRMGEAAEHFGRAAELDPDDAETRYNLGAVLLQQGRVEAAAREMLAALEVDPDYKPALTGLERLAGRVRDPDLRAAVQARLAGK
jgi:tetratricopeptide (TPR) repeat protein